MSLLPPKDGIKFSMCSKRYASYSLFKHVDEVLRPLVDPEHLVAAWDRCLGLLLDDGEGENVRDLSEQVLGAYESKYKALLRMLRLKSSGVETLKVTPLPRRDKTLVKALSSSVYSFYSGGIDLKIMCMQRLHAVLVLIRKTEVRYKDAILRCNANSRVRTKYTPILMDGKCLYAHIKPMLVASLTKAWEVADITGHGRLIKFFHAYAILWTMIPHQHMVKCITVAFGGSFPTLHKAQRSACTSTKITSRMVMNACIGCALLSNTLTLDSIWRTNVSEDMIRARILDLMPDPYDDGQPPPRVVASQNHFLTTVVLYPVYTPPAQTTNG